MMMAAVADGGAQMGEVQTRAGTQDAAADVEAPPTDPRQAGLTFRRYTTEALLPAMAELIAKDLSEPYSVYTYRYFVNEWPQLCETVHDGETLIAVVIGRIDPHRDRLRGYIAMLAVEAAYRKRGLGSTLVQRVVRRMASLGCHEVVLEAELKNVGAIRLYENLGFLRDKRLHRYYMNGSDAYRLKLWLN